MLLVSKTAFSLLLLAAVAQAGSHIFHAFLLLQHGNAQWSEMANIHAESLDIAIHTVQNQSLNTRKK